MKWREAAQNSHRHQGDFKSPIFPFLRKTTGLKIPCRTQKVHSKRYETINFIIYGLFIQQFNKTTRPNAGVWYRNLHSTSDVQQVDHYIITVGLHVLLKAMPLK
jgi:hypothetical protein